MQEECLGKRGEVGCQCLPGADGGAGQCNGDSVFCGEHDFCFECLPGTYGCPCRSAEPYCMTGLGCELGYCVVKDKSIGTEGGACRKVDETSQFQFTSIEVKPKRAYAHHRFVNVQKRS